MSGARIVNTVTQRISSVIVGMIFIGNCQDQTIGSALTGNAVKGESYRQVTGKLPAS